MTQTGIGLPIALVLPANATDADRSATISAAVQVSALAVIVDGRMLDSLSDESRYQIRTVVTALRAARDIAVGLELGPVQIADPSLGALAGYIDFLAAPPGADVAAVSSRLPGVPIWTDAGLIEPRSSVDVITIPRLPGSDRVLVRARPDRRDIFAAVAAMAAVLPDGLIPASEVRVACDADCTAAVYLNPQTLDAVAIVQPRAPVRRLTVSPPASSLATYGGVQSRGAGAELAVSETTGPLVLQIHGWRGDSGTFATGVEVTGARGLTAGEIVARHQAARARQERAVETLIATGTTVLTFRVPAFAGPLTLTAQTTMFAGEGVTDIEQEQIRVNGLDLPRAAGEVPKLPLVEPERVAVPPLAIVLNERYAYSLHGRDRLNGRDAYVVAFSPRKDHETLFEGRAWIDARTFVLLRTDATQTGLKGPIASSREIIDYKPAEQDGVVVSLPERTESFQVYVGPVESTPIHRVTAFAAHEVNAPDYASRLDAAHRSDAVLLRDTPQGYRFLVPQAAAGAGRRQLAAGTRDHVATAVVGTLVDPNISIPLAFAGISYVDFNLFGTGTQLNAFFGGTYGRLSWATRPLAAGRWRLTGDASAVAVAYNDRAFRDGIEHYGENIHQRPAQASLALVGTVAPHLRLRAAYDLGYTHYSRTDSTAADFVLPVNAPVHAARLALEAERGGWNATGWFAAARRQQWRPWGVRPSTDQLDARVFDRYGAAITRSIVWSPRAVAHVEAAWMTGRRLDRFSQFAFGTFDNPLRGYPSVSIRYDTGAAIRSVATWTPASHLRLDGFADLGIARAGDARSTRLYPGLGGAIEAPAPFGWLVAAEWGYGVRGVNANGTTGTHVIRISGYKMF